MVEPARQSPAERLRQTLSASALPLVLPGAPNALTATLIQEAGFEALYVTGAGITNTFLGMPDLGLLTLDELTNHVAAMADVVDLPVVVDADTGFGNAINVQRTVRRLERAGAAAIQIEDQISPKRCGHFGGKQVISRSEMVGKIRAAVDARRGDTLIVARTDALAVQGLDEACARAAAYVAAGAELIFVESPTTTEQMRHITQNVPGWHIANMVEGGRSPRLSRSDLGDLGFAVALYANSAMRGAVAGARQVLSHLSQHGDTIGAGELLISWEDRQALVRKEDFDQLEVRYGPDAHVG
jgi:2-methylisocitrate lyase-like PEP mutase family enzyme